MSENVVGLKGDSFLIMNASHCKECYKYTVVYVTEGPDIHTTAEELANSEEFKKRFFLVAEFFSKQHAEMFLKALLEQHKAMGHNLAHIWRNLVNQYIAEREASNHTHH